MCGDGSEDEDAVEGTIFKAHCIELSEGCHLNVAARCHVGDVLDDQNPSLQDFLEHVIHGVCRGH